MGVRILSEATVICIFSTAHLYPFSLINANDQIPQNLIEVFISALKDVSQTYIH